MTLGDQCLTIETDRRTGDNIQIIARDGLLYFSIEQPWAGDSVSGFGVQTTVDLNKEQTEQVVEFINAHCARRRVR